jgi:hypothetical protein
MYCVASSSASMEPSSRRESIHSKWMSSQVITIAFINATGRRFAMAYGSKGLSSQAAICGARADSSRISSARVAGGCFAISRNGLARQHL